MSQPMLSADVQAQRSVEAGAVPRSMAATVALAYFEAKKLLRHPFTIAAAVLYTAPWLYAWVSAIPGSRYPVLQDADRGTQTGAMFLLGSTVLLTANLAVLRPVRHGTDKQLEVLLLSRGQRALAALLSVVAGAGLAIVLISLRALTLVTAPGAVGRMNLYELATGPMVVLLLGASGVLLGLAFRTVLVAPLILAAIVAANLFAAMPAISTSPARWLLPIALEDVTALPMPGDLLARPAAAHLVYLTALTVLVIGAALLLTGSRALPTGLAIVALILLGVSAPAQMRVPDEQTMAARVAATNRPALAQVCEQHGKVKYCAFPDFQNWIGDWDAIVTKVVRRTPVDEPFSVRQRVFAVGSGHGTGIVAPAPLPDWNDDDQRAGTPGAIAVGTAWGTGLPELQLAAGVAHQIVTGTAQKPNIMTVCGGRSVLVLWLAGQASPSATRSLKELTSNGSGGVILTPAGFGTGLLISHRDAMVALSLLDRPTTTIAPIVTQRWATLRNPTTTTEQAAAVLGVQDPSGPASEESQC